jgi:hypothetical protein
MNDNEIAILRLLGGATFVGPIWFDGVTLELIGVVFRAIEPCGGGAPLFAVVWDVEGNATLRRPTADEYASAYAWQSREEG